MIIECDDEFAGPSSYYAYSPGWGYQVEATGEIVNGEPDGEHWQEGDAEQNAAAAGFEVRNPS